MPGENSIRRILSVRSQLDEQTLIWLAYVCDYPDHETMPGRTFGLPPYYDKDLGRSPSELYIPPLVEKETLNPKREKDQDSPGSNQEKSTPNRPFNDVTSDARPEDDTKNLDESNTKKITVPWASELRLAPSGWRALITGAPGQGKSWLAQMTAGHMAWDTHQALFNRTGCVDDLPLPICLRLEDVLKQCSKQAGENTFTESDIRKAIKHLLGSVQPFDGSSHVQLPHFDQYVSKHLHEKRFWLFLDALEEVEDNAQNQQQLRSFFRAVNKWDTRVLITSRPYAQGRFTNVTAECLGKRAIYEIAPLPPRHVSDFVDRWFNPQAPTPEQDIRAQLSRPAYRTLSKSPQLLTLLCFVASTRGGKLPTGRRVTKTQIYNAIFECLFEHTEDHGISDQRVKFGAVAYELESIGRTMVNRSAALPSIDYRTLRLLIAKVSHERDLTFEHEATIESRLSLYQSLRILTPTTHDEISDWQFTHKEFAAFFAGSCWASEHNIAALPYESNPDADEPSDPEAIKKIEGTLARRVWDPDWERVIAFFVGQTKCPEAFLQTISLKDVYTKSGNCLGHDLFRYRLFVAARLLIEISDPDELIDPQRISILSFIADQTFAYIWQEINHHGYQWNGISGNALDCIAVSNTWVNMSWLKQIQRTIQERPNTFAGGGAAKVLGVIARHAITDLQQQAISILSTTIQKKSISSGVLEAATALSTIAQYAKTDIQRQIIDILTTTIKERPGTVMGGQAVKSLGVIAQHVTSELQIQIFGTLITTIKEQPSTSAASQAANILGTITPYATTELQQQVIDILSTTIQKQAYCPMGGQAAKALGAIALHTKTELQKQIIGILITTIQDQPDTDEGEHAPQVLHAIAQHVTTELQQQAFHTLISVIREKPNARASKHAAVAIGAIAQNASIELQHQAIITLITTIQQKNDMSASGLAAKALGAIAQHTATDLQIRAIDVLTTTIQEGDSAFTGGKAAEALGVIAQRTTTELQQQVINILCSTIQEKPDTSASWNAATSLGLIGQYANIELQKQAINILITIIQERKNIGLTIQRAAIALVTIIRHTTSELQQQAIGIINANIQPGSTTFPDGQAAKALGAIAKHAKTELRQEAIGILITIMQEQPNTSMGGHAAEALGTVGQHANPKLRQHAISILIATIQDQVRKPTYTPAFWQAPKALDNLMDQGYGMKILYTPDNKCPIVWGSSQTLRACLNEN